MAYVNVASWNTDQVAEWIKGLSDHEAMQTCARQLQSSGVTGAKLLRLRAGDLRQLNITRVGHQEIILAAISRLQTLHYTLNSENLQQLAMRLCSKARSLYIQLSNMAPPSSVNATDQSQSSVTSSDQSEPPKQRVTVPILEAVTDTMTSVKDIISWLNTAPFEGQEMFTELKSRILDPSIQLVMNAQRDKFAVLPVDGIRAASKQLADVCDDIIQDCPDSLILLPAPLLIMTIKRKPDEPLGLHIVRAISGVHIITGVKFQSPAHICGKLEEGDEIVQVNYQTVVGWQLGKVIDLLQDKEFGAEVYLTVKKRPKHSNLIDQVYFKPFRLPNKKRTSYRWNSSPRPDLLTSLPRIALPPRLPSPEAAASELTPQQSSDSDSDAFLAEAGGDAASPTSVRHYQPKPRPTLQRRATVTGASPVNRRPPASLEQFWKELSHEQRVRQGLDVDDSPPLRRHTLSSDSEDDLPPPPRPLTCIPRGGGGEPARRDHRLISPGQLWDKSSSEHVHSRVDFSPDVADYRGRRASLKDGETAGEGGADAESDQDGGGGGGGRPSRTSVSSLPEPAVSVSEKPRLEKTQSAPAYDLNQRDESFERVLRELPRSHAIDEEEETESTFEGEPETEAQPPSPSALTTSAPITSALSVAVAATASISSGVGGAGDASVESTPPATPTLPVTGQRSGSAHRADAETAPSPAHSDPCAVEKDISSAEHGSEAHFVVTEKHKQVSDTGRKAAEPHTLVDAIEEESSDTFTSAPDSDTRLHPDTAVPDSASADCDTASDTVLHLQGVTQDSSSSDMPAPLPPSRDSRDSSSLREIIEAMDVAFRGLKTSLSDLSKTTEPSTSTSPAEGKPGLMRHHPRLSFKGRRVSCKDLGQGDCQGWLYVRKEGRGFLHHDKWAKRWLVLHEHVLYSYRNKEAQEAETLVSLPGYQVSPAQDVRSKKFAFRVHSNERSMVFASDSQLDMTKWMNKMGLSAIAFASPQTYTTGGFCRPDAETTSIENVHFSDTDDEDDRKRGALKTVSASPTSSLDRARHKLKSWRAVSPAPSAGSASSLSSLGSADRTRHNIRKKSSLRLLARMRKDGSGVGSGSPVAEAVPPGSPHRGSDESGHFKVTSSSHKARSKPLGEDEHRHDPISSASSSLRSSTQSTRLEVEEKIDTTQEQDGNTREQDVDTREQDDHQSKTQIVPGSLLEKDDADALNVERSSRGSITKVRLGSDERTAGHTVEEEAADTASDISAASPNATITHHTHCKDAELHQPQIPSTHAHTHTATTHRPSSAVAAHHRPVPSSRPAVSPRPASSGAVSVTARWLESPQMVISPATKRPLSQPAAAGAGAPARQKPVPPPRKPRGRDSAPPYVNWKVPPPASALPPPLSRAQTAAVSAARDPSSRETGRASADRNVPACERAGSPASQQTEAVIRRGAGGRADDVEQRDRRASPQKEAATSPVNDHRIRLSVAHGNRDVTAEGRAVAHILSGTHTVPYRRTCSSSADPGRLPGYMRPTIAASRRQQDTEARQVSMLSKQRSISTSRLSPLPPIVGGGSRVRRTSLTPSGAESPRRLSVDGGSWPRKPVPPARPRVFPAARPRPRAVSEEPVTVSRVETADVDKSSWRVSNDESFLEARVDEHREAPGNTSLLKSDDDDSVFLESEASAPTTKLPEEEGVAASALNSSREEKSVGSASAESLPAAHNPIYLSAASLKVAPSANLQATSERPDSTGETALADKAQDGGQKTNSQLLPDVRMKGSYLPPEKPADIAISRSSTSQHPRLDVSQRNTAPGDLCTLPCVRSGSPRVTLSPESPYLYLCQHSTPTPAAAAATLPVPAGGGAAARPALKKTSQYECPSWSPMARPSEDARWRLAFEMSLDGGERLGGADRAAGGRPRLPPRLAKSASASQVGLLQGSGGVGGRVRPNISIQVPPETVTGEGEPRTPLKPAMGVSMIGKQRRTPTATSPSPHFVFPSPSPSAPLSPPQLSSGYGSLSASKHTLPDGAPPPPPPHTPVPLSKSATSPQLGWGFRVLPRYGLQYPPTFTPDTYSLAQLSSQSQQLPAAAAQQLQPPGAAKQLADSATQTGAPPGSKSTLLSSGKFGYSGDSSVGDSSACDASYSSQMSEPSAGISFEDGWKSMTEGSGDGSRDSESCAQFRKDVDVRGARSSRDGAAVVSWGTSTSTAKSTAAVGVISPALCASADSETLNISTSYRPADPSVTLDLASASPAPFYPDRRTSPTSRSDALSASTTRGTSRADAATPPCSLTTSSLPTSPASTSGAAAAPTSMSTPLKAKTRPLAATLTPPDSERTLRRKNTLKGRRRRGSVATEGRLKLLALQRAVKAKQAEVTSISNLLRTPVSRERLRRWMTRNAAILDRNSGEGGAVGRDCGDDSSSSSSSED